MKKIFMLLSAVMLISFVNVSRLNAQSTKKSLVTDAMAKKVAYWVDAPNGGIITYFYDANDISNIAEGEAITKNILKHKDSVEKFIISFIGRFGEADSWITFKDIGFTPQEYSIAKQIYQARPQTKESETNKVRHNETTGTETVKTETAEPVMVEPTFKGDMSKWISKNIKYPAPALEDNIQGNVQVEFYVEKDGSTSRVKVLRSPHTLLSKEAERIILKMPKWNPGTKDGVPFPFKMITTVPFKLQ